MRTVRTTDTKKSGQPSDFYKVGSKYYETEETYNSFVEKEKAREYVFLTINELLGNGSQGYVCGNVGAIIGKKIKESNMDITAIRDGLLEYETYINEFFSDKKCHGVYEKIAAIFTIISKTKNTITYGGCYEIRNLDTNGVYIGETIDFFQRITQHVSSLYSGLHHCEDLQNAFNVSKDISHFKFTPLFLYEIKSENREEEKHKTLYLESAYFLKYKSKNKEIYNSVNPYVALKERNINSAYDVDCEKVLKLLLDDELKIIPPKSMKLIEKDLKTENK